MRLWQSLWWKLSLGAVVISISSGLISMLAMSPVMDEAAFQQAIAPKHMHELISPEIRILQSHSHEQSLTAIILESIQQRLLNPNGMDGYFEARNSSNPHISLALYNRHSIRQEMIEDDFLKMPPNWQLSELRLEQVSSEERLLVIPLDKNGILVIRHWAIFDPLKNMANTLKDVADTYDWWLFLVTLPSILIGVISTYWLSHRLHRLAVLTDRWAIGDYSARSTDVSNDELGEHSRALNRLADKMQEQMHAGYELATLKERQRLARDLHDSIKQQVFAVGLQIHAADQWLEHSPARSKFLLNVAATLNQTVHHDLANLLNRLNPSKEVLDTKLEIFLKNRLAAWEGLIEIHSEIPSGLAIASGHALEIGNILNEAIANALRHGRAQCVRIKLEREGSHLSLSITDDGRGFDLSNHPTGHGLINIRDRAALLPNGQIKFNTTAETGCQLILRWKI